MPTVSENQAIEMFRQLVTPHVTQPNATGQVILDQFVNFYRDVQIDEASDSMMLEGGSSRPHLLDGFIDLRETEAKWDDTEYQWIGLTRQIDSGRDDDNTALCVFLYFDKAAGNEPSPYAEFWGLDDLDAELSKFTSKPYVARLLAIKPTRVTAFASGVG